MLTVNIATLRDIRGIYDKLSKTIDGEPLSSITVFRILTSNSRTRQRNVHKMPEMARRTRG